MTYISRRWAAWFAACGGLITAAIHVSVGIEHLREAPVMAALFFSFVAVCGTCSVVLVVSTSPAVRNALGLVVFAALVTYVLSRTVGLPGQGDDIGQWGDWRGIAAGVCELLALAALVLEAASTGRRNVAVVSARRQPRPSITATTRIVWTPTGPRPAHLDPRGRERTGQSHAWW